MSYLILTLENERRSFAIGDGSTIGRSRASTIQIDDAMVSKQHAEVSDRGNSRYLLRDLNAINGTFHNGKRLEQSGETFLNDGDEIRIGSATLIFTRAKPAGFVPPPSPDDETAVLAPLDVPLETVSAPHGTMSIPLEQFGLREGAAVEDGHEPSTMINVPAATHKGDWLRSLYHLLREGNQCQTEDDLFSLATRIVAASLHGAKVRVFFEAGKPVEVKRRIGKTTTILKKDDPPAKPGMSLIAWAPLGARPRGGTSIIDPSTSQLRTELLSFARRRSVAVLSEDLQSDTRVAVGKAVLREQSTTMIIAPLLSGRQCMGYLVCERAWRRKDSETAAPAGRQEGLPHPEKGPFTAEHLEFIAAAAYPLATMLLNLRRAEQVSFHNRRTNPAFGGETEIVGSSAPFKAAMQIIERVARSDAPVLILGESGTGKELAARALHNQSNRSEGPFEAINCAALPENLVEAELFGHTKGAFTGAVNHRAGCFEMASGGTLFLDEIGELPMAAQSKFLRVLEESKVTRVGESRLRDVDCRIVAATNRDLQAEVAAGRFRGDLYYRLRVVDVTLPPLRRRADDIDLISKFILKRFGNFTLHPDVLQVFRRYRWPGNVRELRNTLERMAVLARPPSGAARGVLVLGMQDVPLELRGAAAEMPVVRSAVQVSLGALPGNSAARPALPDSFVIGAKEIRPLDKLQVEYARWVLKHMGNNKARTAKALNIQRSTLYSWIDWNEDENPKPEA